MEEKRLNIRISKELKDEFDRICKEKCINASEWIRRQIEKFVESEKEIE